MVRIASFIVNRNLCLKARPRRVVSGLSDVRAATHRQ